MEWLISEQLTRVRTSLLFDGFCRKLLEIGLPVARATIHIRQLDPQLRARSQVWELAAGGAVEIVRHHGVEQSDAYLLSPIYRVMEGLGSFRCQLSGDLGEAPLPVLEELKDRGYTDYLALPLAFSSFANNVITFATDLPEGFSAEVCSDLEQCLPFLALLLERRHHQKTAEQLLDTYIGPSTGRRVLSGEIKRGDGGPINAVIWACDLRNFTGISETQPFDRVIALLNTYFDAVGKPIADNGGEILKFIGDAVLAIFPIKDSPEQACQAALKAAKAAFANAGSLRGKLRDYPDDPPTFGIALHLGDVMYGNIGTANRLDFTVIGPAVNLVSRMEALAARFDPPLVLSAEVARHCPSPTRSIGYHQFKGIQGEKEVFTLATCAEKPL